MKKIYFLVIISILVFSKPVLAQFEGKKFLSGSAQIDFGNNNPEMSQSTNGYSAGINVNLGKFKTNTRASGWNLAGSIGGQKAFYQTFTNGSQVNWEKSGINLVGAQIGKFWQFYKHFNEKVGVFAGPGVNATYQNTISYEPVLEGQYLTEIKSNSIGLALGVSAGIYYRLSEKWWIDGSIGFSSPVNINYSITDRKSTGDFEDFRSKTMSYSLTPSFTFPSVGFGVRYFYNR